MSFIQQKLFKYLCPPGDGVITGHSISHIKREYQQKLYKCETSDDISKKWQEHASGLNDNLYPVVLGVPSDTGGGVLRGANWGPIAIRKQISDHCKFFDLGDIKCIPHFIHDDYLSKKVIQSSRQALYGLDNGYPVSPLSILDDVGSELYTNIPEIKIVGLGGDNSISYPLISQWIKSQNKKGNQFAIVHFDAHTDLMPSRLGVELTFSSWASQIIKEMEHPENFIQIGTRSSNFDKLHWEENFKIKQFWSAEVKDKLFLKKLSNYIKALEVDNIYVTIDLDVLDPAYASATGSPEENGLEPHEIISSIQTLNSIAPITGADICELAPFTNTQSSNSITPEPETSLLSSKVIVESLLEALCQ